MREKKGNFEMDPIAQVCLGICVWLWMINMVLVLWHAPSYLADKDDEHKRLFWKMFAMNTGVFTLILVIGMTVFYCLALAAKHILGVGGII